MAVEIKVPEVGESITEGVIVEWHVEDGGDVEMDGPLFELETDKITMTVQAETAGTVHIDVGEDETVQVGQVVGRIEEGEGGEAKDEKKEPAAEEKEEAEPEKKEEATEEKEPKKSEKKAEEKPEKEEAAEEAPKGDGDKLMPAARRLAEQHDVDASDIEGTGKGGRILKEDVQNYLDARERVTASEEQLQEGEEEETSREQSVKKKTEPAAGATPAKAAPDKATAAGTGARTDQAERQTRKPLSQIRKRIAERLLEAKNSTAMLTTFNEVDMTNLMAMRARYKDQFAEKYGIKLGVMSFFVKAAVDALQHHPEVNRFIDGDEFVENHYYDIGIAVSTDRGLMVPVIRDADKLSFAEVELTIADFAKRARDGKIGLDELQGGTFTITNGGVFGSMLSTPILNPPQSAILGMHGIKKRAVVDEETDEITVRQMMYLAVSYDHRVIDGRESVTFLRRIMECIENPERMMFGI